MRSHCVQNEEPPPAVPEPFRQGPRVGRSGSRGAQRKRVGAVCVPLAVGWSATEHLTAAEAAKSSVCGTEDSGPFRQCEAASRCSSIGLSPMRLLAVCVSCSVTVCHGLQPTWIRPHPPELGSPPLQEHGGHTHGSVAGPCGSVARTHPFGCHPGLQLTSIPRTV